MSVGQSWRWEIEVRGQELIITLPGTNYRAIYHKPDSSPQLVARSVPKGDEAAALVSREEFLAHACIAPGEATPSTPSACHCSKLGARKASWWTVLHAV